MERQLGNDPLLRGVPEVEGFKVLEPCVLYAKIGQGGMGTVYRGKHLNLDIDVAVKCLKGSLAAEGPAFIARFQREAKIAASIHHQNLVQVYDISHKNGVHYLVMEYVMGETARDRVKRKGPLSEAEACRILLGAAHGLGEAHGQRIVHRDIKPDNILISYDGKVKVSDLGLAKALEGEDANTLTHGVMGTPQYMAPEQWADTAHVGPSADVWALGATLYFLLSGENAIGSGTMQQVCRRICVDPFPDLRARRSGLSAAALAILAKCVKRETEQRYRDARELVPDLQALLAIDRTSLADPESGSHVVEDTLVSPPPPNTMARIRVVLDSKLMTETVGSPGAPDRDRAEQPGAAAPAVASPAAAAPVGSASPASGASEVAPRGPRAKWLVASVGAAVALLWIAFFVFREQPIDAAEGSRAPVPVPVTALPLGPNEQGGARREPETVEPAVEPEVVVAPLVPPLVRIELEGGLAEGADNFRSEPELLLRGRVHGARVPRATARTGHGAEVVLEIHADGVFEGAVPLAGDGREIVTLFTEGLEPPLELAVVRDSQRPVLTLVAPEPSARVARAEIDVRIRMVEAHPRQVDIAGQPMTAGPGDEWSARVPLDQEGENRFLVHALDQAGNQDSIEVHLVRDTTPPRLLSTEPGSDAVLVGGAERTLALEFDEELSRLTIQGRPVRVDGQRATDTLPVRYDSPLTLSLRAFDLAENELARELSWTVEVQPRFPEGWEILSTQVGTDSWARRVKDPRTGVVFVLVDPGSFPMGSLPSEGEPDERPLRVEQIDAPFYLAETELTQAQWDAVGDAPNPSKSLGDELPVESVRWLDAQGFCQRMGYRLPSEKEWEYACRAGGSKKYSTGDRLEQANSAESRSVGTVAVRSFKANTFGLFDMHGNVKEWCEDEYRPGTESRHELRRVIRGGSYLSRADGCRSASREGAKPAERSKDVGFRPAYSPR